MRQKRGERDKHHRVLKQDVCAQHIPHRQSQNQSLKKKVERKGRMHAREKRS
jgi:hypothetical protein